MVDICVKPVPIEICVELLDGENKSETFFFSCGIFTFKFCQRPGSKSNVHVVDILHQNCTGAIVRSIGYEFAGVLWVVK